MCAVLGSLRPAEAVARTRDITLLIARETWFRCFLQNLGELFRRDRLSSEQLTSSPGAFWPDVFVNRRLPWRRFLQSGTYHVLALVAIWEASQFLALQTHALPRPTFTHDEVVSYSALEYLPPIDTRIPEPANLQKPPTADPEYSAQPIISVPPEADNRSQTIVTPPSIRLKQDVAMPNVVAWRQRAQVPIGPAPVVLAAETSRLAPRMERSVIAPPSQMQNDVQRDLQAALQGPQPAVIAPPPAVETDATRRLGDLYIEHSAVIAPAPQLSLDAQRTVPSRSSAAVSEISPNLIAPPPAVEAALTHRLGDLTAHSSVVAPAPQLSLDAHRALPGGRSTALDTRSAQVIAPPPSLGAAGASRSGNIIALSLHPAVSAPVEPVVGNRRGTFAATPEGHHGASGAAAASESKASGKEIANGSGSKGNDLPSGLYVGKSSSPITSRVAGNSTVSDAKANSVNRTVTADARLPRVSVQTSQPESASKLSDVERAIFGSRKYYSLSLNMPNLNSAGGSWIIRFAALKPDPNAESYPQRVAAEASASGVDPGDLSAPSATRKVDPAYPLDLMRQHVGGTVILYGVIHTDGTVGNIRVLRSADEQLDRFASEAIAKWQFQPATKNGAPVDVEATFWIPFQPAKTNF